MRKSAQLDQNSITGALAALQKLNESQGLPKNQPFNPVDRSVNKHRNTVSFQQSESYAIESSALQKDIQKLVLEMKAQEEKKSRQSFKNNVNESNPPKTVDLEYLDRFDQHLNQKEQWIQAEQARTEQKRMSMNQAVPTINDKSKKLTQKYVENPPLWQRSIQMHSVQQKSKENQASLRQQQEEEEFNQCTFKPSLNNLSQDIKSKLLDPPRKKKEEPKIQDFSFKPKLNKTSLKLASNLKEKSSHNKKKNLSMEKMGSSKPHMNSKSRKIVQKFGEPNNKQTYLYDNYMSHVVTDSIQKSQSRSTEKMNSTFEQGYRHGDFHNVIRQLKNVG